jgi:hypothetical protein
MSAISAYDRKIKSGSPISKREKQGLAYRFVAQAHKNERATRPRAPTPIVQTLGDVFKDKRKLKSILGG